jgi:hypothetical protein
MRQFYEEWIPYLRVFIKQGEIDSLATEHLEKSGNEISSLVISQFKEGGYKMK